MQLTNYAPSLAPFWSLIAASGRDPAPLFQSLNVDPGSIHDPSARVPFSRVAQIWRWIAREIEDPCIGLRLIDHWHPSAAGPLGYAWLSSSTLRTAIGRLQRYSRIVNQGINLKTRERGGEFSLVVSFRTGVRGVPVWCDAILAVIAALCRVNYGPEFQLASVSFTHPAPACSGDFYAHFRCPIHFAARDNRLTLPLALLDRPLPGANPELAKLHDQIMIDYLATLGSDTLIEAVKAAIVDQLPSGSATDANVAAALHLHERTLQRRLEQQGTTFKTLLNEVRENLALKYLQDSNMTLNEISFLLGFTEISSFSRAFRRWTGLPPSEYREAS